MKHLPPQSLDKSKCSAENQIVELFTMHLPLRNLYSFIFYSVKFIPHVVFSCGIPDSMTFWGHINKWSVALGIVRIQIWLYVSLFPKLNIIQHIVSLLNWTVTAKIFQSLYIFYLINNIIFTNFSLHLCKVWRLKVVTAADTIWSSKAVTLPTTFGVWPSAFWMSSK